MSLEDNKAVVRRFAVEVWNRGNLAVLDDLVSRDVTRNGQAIGVVGLRGVVSMIRAAVADFESQIVDLIAEGTKWSGATSRRAPTRDR